MTFAWGGYPEISNDDFSRNLCPAGGCDGSLTPWSGEDVRAGQTHLFCKAGTEMRSAWLIDPALTSSYLTSPDKIGSPASSVSHMCVALFFRNVFFLRSQTAPEPACHVPSVIFSAP